MTYRDIFDSALRMICEQNVDGDVSDYEERATYLLATFCRQCAKLDAKYRAAYNLTGGGKVSSAACIGLDAEFPLSEALSPSACYYLSAMLTLDENEDMSEQFFSLYTDALASLSASLPAKSGPIVNRYS